MEEKNKDIVIDGQQETEQTFLHALSAKSESIFHAVSGKSEIAPSLTGLLEGILPFAT